MTATATVTPGTAEDSRLTYALLGVVTLVSAALPFVFLSQSADGAHTAFHIIGMLACVAWLLVLARVRRATRRSIRVLGWIVTVCVGLWLIGHIGEFATILATSGVDHDHETFDNPTHQGFAAVAVPGWMLSVLGSTALLIVAGVQALRRRGRTS